MFMHKIFVYTRNPITSLHDIEKRLQCLCDQVPLVLGNLVSVELLKAIDRSTRNVRVQNRLLVELTAVQRLVWSFDLDGNGRLALFAYWDLLVFTLDGCSVIVSMNGVEVEVEKYDLHSTKRNNHLHISDRVVDYSSDRSVDTQSAIGDVNTNNDRVFLVEDLDWTEDAREDSEHFALLLLDRRELLHVLLEVVKQVVNDVGCEDLDTNVVGVLLCFFVDLDIETQHYGVLLGLFQHCACGDDITLVYWSQRDVGDWNLHLLQELKQSLKRTKSRSLYSDTTAGLGDLAKQVLEIAHNIVGKVVLVVIWSDNEQSRAGDGIFEAVGGNLDTQSCLDFLVVNIL